MAHFQTILQEQKKKYPNDKAHLNAVVEYYKDGGILLTEGEISAFSVSPITRRLIADMTTKVSEGQKIKRT